MGVVRCELAGCEHVRMKLHGFVSLDCEFVVMDWHCLLINRRIQVIPRVLQGFPLQSTKRVRKSRTYLGEIDRGNFAFFEELGTVDDEDTAEVEFP